MEKYVGVVICTVWLLTPMSLAWFSKGKGKDRETKDRHLNGHRFATGPCLGPTLCVVCDKPASGKELLHCSGCTAIVHKSCKESVPPCLKVGPLFLWFST
uniref:Phorbol-ester/DAG-type domain-containing protein n=1 Tax=Poecilia reticulata TaxID=8081 RepID=A0A3P9Q9Y2_POERE